MTASTACRNCGTEPRQGARFCDTCGTPVAQHETRAEYKQVTVLFADVVHSMDIAAALGAERLREIVATLADRCALVVQQYGGTVDKFTGDGIMAVFGAPMALEDHAIRACLAALGVQKEAQRLAAEVRQRDDVDLELRVGLNSGEVIAGEVGSRSFGYTAIGEQVGIAQRMESAAPPGGVMLSASTARLVDGAATLGEPELVHIRDAEEPVPARRLLAVEDRQGAVDRAESRLVGRRWEMAAVEGVLDRAAEGYGAVVGVVGLPGIGKSRLVREVAAMAAARGVEVFTTFGESHASDIPFYVVARLLRAAFGVGDLDPSGARMRVRALVPDAEPEDLLLFDELLGIADPEITPPKIDPGARRRRLTALVNAASLGRSAPAVYVIEDVHWIDEVSESMIADFVSVIPQTHSLVLISYRPAYRGALSRVPGAQSIALGPLSGSETAALVTELLGPDPSVSEFAGKIAERADGNPFFVEEIVRDLAERDVLRGKRGAYVSTVGAAEVSVPATVQATIAARIDRLDPVAKRTLSAAAVIGSRFDARLLQALDVEPTVTDLVTAELVDQVRFTREPEYVFHHPLIRTVAYDSQLKSDRAELHRRLAAVIEDRGPESAYESAALIAEHLEAAGDLRAAYGWHMRTATWATTRDIRAARLSWERARKIADALPPEEPDRVALRIAPRTMLCGIAFRIHERVDGARFDELRELCIAAGDKASLAIGMAGLVIDHAFQGRILDASRLASEHVALIESVGDPTLTMGLSFGSIYVKLECSEWSDVLRWSQRVIDLADGDPSKGSLLGGSPLAAAVTTRGVARYCLGHPGWRYDLRHGLTMARNADPLSYARSVIYAYGLAIPMGVLKPDDHAMGEMEDALQSAERSTDDTALTYAQIPLGLALVHRPTAAERERGQKLLASVGELFLRQGAYNRSEQPIVNIYADREHARRGLRDDAIPRIRAATEHLALEGQLLTWGIPATGVLVETLLARGTDEDLAEAESATERLAATPSDDPSIVRDIWLLRLRAQLAQARGEAAAYTQCRDRYRDMAKSFGFDGHIEWAEAMP